MAKRTITAKRPRVNAKNKARARRQRSEVVCDRCCDVFLNESVAHVQVGHERFALCLACAPDLFTEKQGGPKSTLTIVDETPDYASLVRADNDTDPLTANEMRIAEAAVREWVRELFDAHDWKQLARLFSKLEDVANERRGFGLAMASFVADGDEAH